MRCLNARRMFFVGLVAMSASACSQGSGAAAPTGRGALVQLADTLDPARAKSAPVPSTARDARTWSFAQAQPAWRAITREQAPSVADVQVEQLADCTRLSLVATEGGAQRMLVGGIAIELEKTRRDEWTGLLVRARTRERLSGISVACDIGRPNAIPRPFSFMGAAPGTSPVFDDGSVQDYLLPLTAHDDEMLHDIALFLGAPQPASIDILSIELVPRGASYKEEFGVHALTRGSQTRRTLFAHTPSTLTWQLHVPRNGRMDFALTTLLGEEIVYRAGVSTGGGAPTSLFTETASQSDDWLQRSIDLSRWSGQSIELSLEAASAQEGSVALFGAPIVSGEGVSGEGASKHPNVIFYVIDGAGADLMSLYGYNRRTTPYLERLAEEGVVFEHAYSNSTWTQPSTASFMTSLHHSVLGGLRRGVHSTPVPNSATTMAEHMRAGGYATAVFTTNPNCARVIGLERGVDVMNDGHTSNASTSSVELHEQFWRFRRDYPGRPYWIHFQTTDVHEPNRSVAPYAGLFVSSAERSQLDEWDRKMRESASGLFGTTSISAYYDAALTKAAVDRRAYFNARRGLYDETMAHQDRELARFVDALKAAGEWENTLLVIGSDHGHPAGTFARFGRGLFEPQPEPWEGALFDSYATRIPLLFVWPKKFAGGRRIEQAVSMIDVLPTILELAGLPPAEVAQGRSLAPLLFGRELEHRPVIFDEFRVDEATGEMIGNLEMIDGRWGASLEIGPMHEDDPTSRGRHAVPAGGRWGAVHPLYADAPRLLLYDVWKDPFALRAVNDEQPELVKHYEQALLAQWSAHRALAQRFGEADAQPLTPEALKQLRDLGYVR